MLFSQKHKLLDIWMDLSSSLLFCSPDVSRKGKKTGACQFRGGREEWRAVGMGAEARTRAAQSKWSHPGCNQSVASGGGGSGGMIMKVHSVYHHYAWKANFTWDVCADFSQKTCCLDLLMLRVQSPVTLVASIIRYPLNVFRWAKQPGVITLLPIFPFISFISFTRFFISFPIFCPFPFSHSRVCSPSPSLLMEIFRYWVVQCL